VWGTWPAALHLGGLLVIGVGFLLLFLEVGRAIIVKYGGLAQALGWPQLFAGSKEPSPAPTVVASTMVVIIDTLALVAGATIIVISLINLFAPSFAVNALFAKNLTYFFGHVLINSTIYMAVIGVYELLPRYTQRPWKATRVFLAAWTGSLTMVLLIYTHHLLMDFVMPQWALIVGQVLSFTNSFPVLLVTGLGALAIIHRSGLRWDMVTGLLFLAMFGWMAGVIPAVIDAVIAVNLVMHNTMWVPGHFHFYLLLGLLPILFGFMYYLLAGETPQASQDVLDRWALNLYAVAGLGFVAMFLYGGRQSVPRRWAEHLPEWLVYDRIASVFSVFILVMAAVFVVRFLAGIPRLVKAP
jgi:cytochrome c oxidase subunit 1